MHVLHGIRRCSAEHGLARRADYARCSVSGEADIVGSRLCRRIMNGCSRALPGVQMMALLRFVSVVSSVAVMSCLQSGTIFVDLSDLELASWDLLLEG